MTDVISAVVLFGVFALWVVWSRQAILDRVTSADRIRSALDRRPDDTPTLLKSRIWQGRR